ncbi:2-aminoethylphosphonate ABC transporter ATP-binding protein (TC 3.A.1.9.1) [hydrothermal vent metagenome]|uniref:2-aminoethylphosphonate ABC transporter ATP-binding protein (TC 3.A.1.9.1) n=1 Tax=hydrothermal vent metagenome TaxID=652676 RepID=A0A3B0RUG9_9ZZZZ
MGNKSPFLKIRHLTKMFGTFTALKNISLDVDEGEFICFLGPSGCGKTTFLRAIAGLDIQTSGTIEQAGKDISALPPAERDFGIVFQSYALFPNLTVNANVAYGLENAGRNKSDVKARVAELLEMVGLSDQGDKYPAQLSGGQQQRIALARALATSPGLLLLDEPLSALDAKVRTFLRHEIKDLQAKLGITTVMVTHDQEEALTMADRIVVMDHGTIEQVGTPLEIYREPATLFVADFIGEMNQIPAVADSKDTVQIGDITLSCNAHSQAKGTKGILTIRPEDVVPQTKTGSSKNKNTISATIREMEFLGSFWRATLTDPKLQDRELIADFSINAVSRMGLDDGEKIKVELPQKALRFYGAEN